MKIDTKSIVSFLSNYFIKKLTMLLVLLFIQKFLAGTNIFSWKFTFFVIIAPYKGRAKIKETSLRTNSIKGVGK